MLERLSETRRRRLVSAILQTLAIYPSARRPRRIVTVSGRGVRGIFPSRKAGESAKFESLVEEMALRFLEVAPLVKSIKTQPHVFEYLDGSRKRRYTPDVAIETLDGVSFLEVKDDETLTTDSEEVERIKAAVRYFRPRGGRLHIVLRADLIADDLQRRLELLLRERPLRGRYRANIDATLWDPERSTVPSADVQRQWQDAQRQCDDLLGRIMKRDPDDLLPVLPR